MMPVYLAAEASGQPPWLQVVLVAIPAAATVAVAYVSAGWLKERHARKSSTQGAETQQPSQSVSIPPPSVAIQPADPLVVKLIEGLQNDLKLARAEITSLVQQRMLDIQQIASLTADLDDAEEKLAQLTETLRIAHSLEEDHKIELIELRRKVAQLEARLREQHNTR
jgi:septal ring factor EnvC (AmiA/AmiB activator)